MGSESKCTSYMASIFPKHQQTKYCSINDIKKVCKDNDKKFNVHDAMQLCKLEQEASKKFWQNKYM